MKLLTVGIRIHVAEKTEFETLCQYLTSKNINYFKYHTADTRPRKIVLFGLHAMKTEELKATLNDNGIHPEDIRTLKLRENHYSYDQQTVYLLYFKPGTVKMSDLRNIKAINQIIVKWAPYTPRSHHKYPQCRNCQMYGHSSINCHMPTRCLVCAADHKTDDCSKKVSRAVLEHKRATGAEIDRSFVKCANCGENHAASFHGCEARKKYTELQEKLRSRSTKQKQRTPHYQLNDLDFPELTRPHTNHQMPNSYSNIAYQHQKQDDTMQKFMMSMMETFNNLINKLSTMIDQLTRSLLNKQQLSSP